MSPFLVLLDAAHSGFPRVSGDEPRAVERHDRDA